VRITTSLIRKNVMRSSQTSGSLRELSDPRRAIKNSLSSSWCPGEATPPTPFLTFLFTPASWGVVLPGDAIAAGAESGWFVTIEMMRIPNTLQNPDRNWSQSFSRTHQCSSSRMAKFA
jgi:hypothetical protein